MTPTAFAVLALAAWRAAALLAEDRILAGPRRRIARRWPPTKDGPSWQAVLAGCARCLSVWTAGVAAAAGRALGAVDGWRWTLLAWGGCAGAAAVLAALVPGTVTPGPGPSRSQ